MANKDPLLCLMKALQGFDTKVKKATAKVVVYNVKAKDRTKLASDVNAALKKEGLNFQANVTDLKESTFPITTLTIGKDKVVHKVVYKPLKGGGSGAGAAATKLGESAQAVYAAMANVLKKNITTSDISKENFEKANKLSFTDEDFAKIKNELPDDWIQSSIKGANALRKEFSGSSFEYHRGTNKVDIVENVFKAINKKEKAFGDLNKWSPADIYLIDKRFDPKVLQKENTLKGLNAMMLKLIEEKKLIGVSLKKIESGNGRISRKNFPKDPKLTKATFRGTSSTLDAMDGYINWGNQKNERIQFRSFGDGEGLTGWQGEIKGASANQGKISLGPLNFLLKEYGVGELPSSKDSAALAKENSVSHAKIIAKLMVEYGMIKNNEMDTAVTTIQGRPSKYRYSKYLVLLLLNKMKKMNKDTADNLTQDMYLYASSQSSFSAPYLKLE